MTPASRAAFEAALKKSPDEPRARFYLAIADEQAGSLKIAKLNVDDAPNTARQYEVMSIPTMILFKDGQPVKKIIGAKPKAALMGELADYL